MKTLSIILSIVFISYAISEIVYFSPRREQKKAALIFDNRVFAVIDGLYLTGMKFRCTDGEMRFYARKLLEKAHSLPATEFLLSHTIAHSERPNVNGRTFHGSTGLHGDHITFALLCIIEYGKDNSNPALIKECEQLLLEARHIETHYDTVL